MRLALLLVLLSGWTLQAAERPNFLFIYTDDQRYDAMSVVQKEQGERGRFPWFQTPHMDRLAAEGVRFRNAFVVCSLCAPGRAVNLTGRYNHLNGIASNFRPFPVVIEGTPITAEGNVTVNDWTTLLGTIISDRRATLHMDGRLVADKALPGLIAQNPNEAMQIGADLGSPAVAPAPPRFRGWIEQVRLFNGQWNP